MVVAEGLECHKLALTLLEDTPFLLLGSFWTLLILWSKSPSLFAGAFSFTRYPRACICATAKEPS